MKSARQADLRIVPFSSWQLWPWTGICRQACRGHLHCCTPA